jgi:uncharacterized protein involved in outer membrane biogenesis
MTLPGLMRRVPRWNLVVLAVLLALGAALLLAKDALAQRLLEGRVRREAGVPAHLGQVEVRLGSASVRIRDFQLFNPPEFGGAVFVDLPELYLQADLGQLLRGKLRFKLVRLHLREFNVIRDQAGRLNLDALSQHPAQPASAPEDAPAKPDPGSRYAGIDQLRLTVDRFNYTDYKNPSNNRQFEVGLRDEVATNLATTAELETWSQALLLRVMVQQIFNK